MAAKKELPEWMRVAYRGVRTSVATAITQTLLLQPDWTDPKEGLKTIAVSFASGFLVALAMWIRDQLGEKHVVSKSMPI